MNAVILAAGRGSRLKGYTEELPKGMLPVWGQPMLERQVEVLRQVDVNEISIVTGYKAEKIQFPGVQTFVNPAWAKTNMVASLMCAKPVLNQDVLVSYSDILYEPHLAKAALEAKADIAVVVDQDWRAMWQLRYGTTETDLESLAVDEAGHIVEIGKPLEHSHGLAYRYVGLIKFSREGMAKARALYARKQAENTPWFQSGKAFSGGYMTDLLHELMVSGVAVKAVPVRNGWWEFDTEEDYEKAVDPAFRREFQRFLAMGPGGNGA